MAYEEDDGAAPQERLPRMIAEFREAQARRAAMRAAVVPPTADGGTDITKVAIETAGAHVRPER